MVVCGAVVLDLELEYPWCMVVCGVVILDLELVYRRGMVVCVDTAGNLGDFVLITESPHFREHVKKIPQLSCHRV